jgi:hypothetical protein
MLFHLIPLYSPISFPSLECLQMRNQVSACYYVRANLTKVTYKQIKRDIITKTH